MFIRNCLTPRRNLTVVSPSERIADTLSRMEDHLSLPVVAEDGAFLGIVSKRTIFESFRQAAAHGVSFDTFLASSVATCIDATVPCLTFADHFEATLEIITRHPFVPIVEDGLLVGIVKRGDVQRSLSVVFATEENGSRLLLGTPEIEGVLYRLFTVTHRLAINVITAVVFDAGRDSLNRRLILKVARSDKLDTLIDQLGQAGFLVIEVDR